MNPKRPPKKKGPCKLGGDHIPKGPADVHDDIITHTCACGVSWSRLAAPKPKPKPKPKGKTIAAAAVILAVLIPLSAAKCGGGQHQGLPVHSRNWWIQNLPPSDYIVFGGQKPLGQWEQQGWVRRPPGSGLPRVRVWVQK